MDDLDEVLLAKAHGLCQNPAFRDVVWRHHRYRRQDSGLGQLSTRIHPQDQMLRHSLRHWKEVNRSLSQYFNVALQQHEAQQQLLHLLFNDQRDSVIILDFACGFGRSLRFLTQSATRTRVWASDVQHEAVDFVVQEFGVNGLYSSFEPAEFQPGRTFDFIWVASLFSHLPARLFSAWLQRLSSLLTPSGVLCFSVHDECLLPPDVTLPAAGLHFVPASEIEELDKRAYGTSHVSEDFVRAAIGDAFGHAKPTYARLRRALATEQDVYVVPRDLAHDLKPLLAFRKGTWGCVDRCEISEAGELDLCGWAASTDDGPADQVTVSINGEVYSCPTGLSRDDVKAVLGDDRLGTSGWEFRHYLKERDVFLEISAESAVGERALLYAGPLRAANARLSSAQTAGLRQAVREIGTSPLWQRLRKLRWTP